MPSTLAQTATILAVGREPASPPVNRERFQHFGRAACAATATKVDGIGRLLPVRRLFRIESSNRPV